MLLAAVLLHVVRQLSDGAVKLIVAGTGHSQSLIGGGGAGAGGEGEGRGGEGRGGNEGQTNITSKSRKIN